MLSMEFCSCKIIKVICLYSCLWSSNQPNWQRDPVRAQRTGDETFPTLVFVGFVFLFFSTSDSLSQVHKFSLLPFQFIKCNILCCFVLFLFFLIRILTFDWFYLIRYRSAVRISSTLFMLCHLTDTVFVSLFCTFPLIFSDSRFCYFVVRRLFSNS